jgi:hypothetical protein
MDRSAQAVGTEPIEPSNSAMPCCAGRSNGVMRAGMLPHLVDRPRVSRHEALALTPEQAQGFLDASRGHRLEAFFAVAIACGLRRGEALALRRFDASAALAHHGLSRGVLPTIRRLAAELCPLRCPSCRSLVCLHADRRERVSIVEEGVQPVGQSASAPVLRLICPDASRPTEIRPPGARSADSPGLTNGRATALKTCSRLRPSPPGTFKFPPGP